MHKLAVLERFFFRKRENLYDLRQDGICPDFTSGYYMIETKAQDRLNGGISLIQQRPNPGDFH